MNSMHLHCMVFVYNGVYMARWLSWLERRPVTAEVRGSNPLRVVNIDNKFSEVFLTSEIFLCNKKCYSFLRVNMC